MGGHHRGRGEMAGSGGGGGRDLTLGKTYTNRTDNDWRVSSSSAGEVSKEANNKMGTAKVVGGGGGVGMDANPVLSVVDKEGAQSIGTGKDTMHEKILDENVVHAKHAKGDDVAMHGKFCFENGSINVVNVGGAGQDCDDVRGGMDIGRMGGVSQVGNGLGETVEVAGP
ncbi:hypothetical protein Q3G72_016390 [Acer saccharum]|nr:hypothetical protein Q3G72_016390 [Acer saccharum]